MDDATPYAEKLPLRRLLVMPWRWSRRVWLVIAACSPVWYYLSSGPVLATAFWLREKTGWNEFYFVMVCYLPLLLLPRWIWDAYIEWWVNLLDTVGPG